MADLGLHLTFVDPETSVAFSRELKAADTREKDFRVATFDSKLNVDAATLILVLKSLVPLSARWRAS